MRSIIRFVIDFAAYVIKGGPKFYAWLAFLGVFVLALLYGTYLQATEGLIVTGLSNQVTDGLYIANFVFMVGVAAGAVTIVFPAYVYHHKGLHDVTVLGEMLAVSAVMACNLFILSHMGRPERLWHMMPPLGIINIPSSALALDVLTRRGSVTAGAEARPRGSGGKSERLSEETFNMQYGHFDDANREYVITRPDTPLPWINYLGCQAYFGIISNTAGGYSFYRDARLRRITRYRYNNVPFDFGGRYIYLRDDESGEFWSPSWQPTRHEVEDYSCRHGMGYSTIGSSYRGIAASTRYFVPLDENLEIWQFTVTNHRPTPATLSAFSCIEFCLWDAQDDATNFQRNFSTGQVEIEDGVIYHKTEYRERRDHFAYFACSRQPDGFDTQREAFLGPYRGWDKPLAVERGAAGNSVAHGWSPIGSHQVKLTLQPGETQQIVFVLGYHENPRDQKFDPPGSQTINKRTVKPVLARYLDPAQADAAFDKLRVYWEGLLGILDVHTPDQHTDRMVNIWNAYQCMATFNMSRSASFYESGIGRGLGFRDSNQDLLGFVQMDPARARERILDLAAT